MRKVIVFSLVLLTASSAFAAFGGGSGTKDDPYQITNRQDLYYLSTHSELWDKSFILTQDIDLSQPDQMLISPIGINSSNPFKGRFNGNGHVISSIEMEANQDHTGLFGYLLDANIHDLNLKNVNITASANVFNVGCLCGTAENSIIKQCSVENSLIAGESNSGHFGLLAGQSLTSVVHGTSCSGNVSAFSAGGFVGYCEGSRVVNCSFVGTVNGTAFIGGFVGYITLSIAAGCYSDGVVLGAENVGGFAGFSSTYISDCYSNCNVEGLNNVGGFSGVSGLSQGTFYTWSVIKNCYSSGAVSGRTAVGGMTGYQYVSENYKSTDYIGCFWNKSVNTSLSGISNYDASDLRGISTEDMQSAEVFIDAGWDFAGETENGLSDIWTIAESSLYPVLTKSRYHFLGGGIGTEEDPFLVYTKGHLLDPMLQDGLSYPIHLRLMADIDFQGGVCPMLFRCGFQGVFDGNDKKISNFIMVDPTTPYGRYSGFILMILDPDTIVKDLTLVNPKLQINTDLQNGGILTGMIWNGAIIDSCHVVNAIGTASRAHNPPNIYGINIAGIVNWNQGTIRNCSFSGNIEATEAAGIAAYNYGVIENCKSSVKLLATLTSGGLTGENRGTISRSYTEGSIIIQGPRIDYFAYVGGLAGENRCFNDGEGIIYNCYSNCTVISNCRAAGGLVGSSWGGLIKDCYATGSVKGFSYIGGFVGTIQSYIYNPAMGVIENCYATGNVSGDNRVGGFAGENGSSIIRNCYATGNVSGTTLRIGGFAGTVYFYPYGGIGTAVVDKCYSTGKVSGSTQTGGFVGRRLQSSIITNCYWNTQTSGWTWSEGGLGKTTAQMQTQSTFAGWDFGSVWYMAGYPVLRWEISPLQARIDAAADGDLIAVEPGVYDGRLYFKGKNVTLFSDDPATVILRGRGVGPVITLKGTENQTCAIDGFTIEGGSAQFPGGGGIFGGPSGAATAAVRNCIIQNNRTSDYGGGIGGLKGQISNCIIRDNVAKYGGGLSWCSGIIKNCLINDNTAAGGGNAVSHCDGQVLNCTIISNPSTVSQVSSSNAQFGNCILYGQTNDFENCAGTIAYSCYPSTNDPLNICDDPLFADPNNGDFRLQPLSPCRNTGDVAYVPDPNETDLDGNRRIVGGCIDMGAYEYPNAIPVADAGADITTYAWIDGFIRVNLNGNASSDMDGDTLSYNWYNDANELIATGAEPNIVLASGEHAIKLVVDDGKEFSAPDSCAVTVVAPIEKTVKMLPQIIVLRARRSQILARIEFAQVDPPQLDPLQPMMLIANSKTFEALNERLNYSDTLFTWYLNGVFDFNAMLTSGAVSAGNVPVTLVTRLQSGEWVFGTTVLKVFN